MQIIVRLPFLSELAAAFDQAFCQCTYPSSLSGMLGWPLHSSLLLRGQYIFVLLLCDSFAACSVSMLVPEFS